MSQFHRCTSLLPIGLVDRYQSCTCEFCMIIVSHYDTNHYGLHKFSDSFTEQINLQEILYTQKSLPTDYYWYKNLNFGEKCTDEAVDHESHLQSRIVLKLTIFYIKILSMLKVSSLHAASYCGDISYDNPLD